MLADGNTIKTRFEGARVLSEKLVYKSSSSGHTTVMSVENCLRTCNDFLPSQMFYHQTFILKNNQNDKTLFIATLYWIIFSEKCFFTICYGIVTDQCWLKLLLWC